MLGEITADQAAEVLGSAADEGDLVFDGIMVHAEGCLSLKMRAAGNRRGLPYRFSLVIPLSRSPAHFQTCRIRDVSEIPPVSRKPSTRIGDGAPAVVLEEMQKHFPVMDFIVRGDDIRKPTDWRIHEDKHSIVVHLSGHMSRLETELDGFGGSKGAALPGEIWTVPAERQYASHACGKTIEYAVIMLQPHAKDILLGSAAGRLDIKPLAGVRDDFLHHAVRQMIAAMRAASDVSDMLAQSLSHSISLHLLSLLALDGLGAAVSKVTGPLLNKLTVRRLRDHIHDRLDERLTLEELAKIAGMTTHQFLVAFRKAFSSTPGQYIIQQRLRSAQNMLLNTRKDITTIALECGFSSHSHLTASFTKQVGCSPSIFRTTARKFQIPLW
ncbi:MAG: hypothetical protein B7Z37_12235 [Verrucomicrobia bacterium 12-59-8]|nr:MAG: hypothetical protein B7Z37_12235 [Verrucomicrobia bacterium 12-59-8]